MRQPGRLMYWFALLAMVIVGWGSALAAATSEQPAVLEHDLEDIDEIVMPRIVQPANTKSVSKISETPQVKAAPRYLTLVIGGDLGFGGSQQPVVADSGVRSGRRYPFETLTRGLKPLLKADLAFANLESVVTASNKLSAVDKAFNFRMHPAGARHLVEAGFNVLSTANNHAIDFGSIGIKHTIESLRELQGSGLLSVHGVATDEEAMFTPSRFARRGASFAFAAAGIGGIRATPSSPGQVHVNSAPDFDRLTRGLSLAAVDYRILSVHYGQELQVRPSAADRQKLAAVAVASRQIDLVIGHHAHTVAGVQRVGRGLVFYGLGNLLHLGMQDMGKFNECRDFGLVARLHLLADANEGDRLIAQAVEIHALDDMHIGSRARQGQDGRNRIEVVNHLSSELTDENGAGLRFYPRADGSGLYCAPGADKLVGAVGKLCKGWQAPELPDQTRQRQLSHACRYMRKDYSNSEKIAELRKTITPQRKSGGLKPFARAAFEPRD